MPKRKRTTDVNGAQTKTTKSPRISHPQDVIHLQIVTGSYERVLHGFTAAIPTALLATEDRPSSDASPSVSFADSFLLNAHTSAITCMAVSPSPPSSAASQKVILATGSTDEKINLFHLSTRIPQGPVLPGLGAKIHENSSNRSLGTLYTHDASVTALHFPNRSKLLSSCGNNVIAVTSTKTFNTLSLIKAPNPKHPNRPTGDTSTASTLPNGVNDFAVHPSMKLMISVGRAEKNMRLWNLVTGRKAGVLAFHRDMLKAVGEGTRWGSGEGRRVLWSPEGDEFSVVFEKGICIFGMDCKPRATISPVPNTKLHQVQYVPGTEIPVLAMSTEDGRVLFYATSKTIPIQEPAEEQLLPTCIMIGQLGGKAADVLGRIKDFQIAAVKVDELAQATSLLVTTAGSDGFVRIWTVSLVELIHVTREENNASLPTKATTNGTPVQEGGKDIKRQQIGRLLGTYETSNRITCLASFCLSGEPENDLTTLQEESDDESDESKQDDDEEFR